MWRCKRKLTDGKLAFGVVDTEMLARSLAADEVIHVAVEFVFFRTTNWSVAAALSMYRTSQLEISYEETARQVSSGWFECSPVGRIQVNLDLANRCLPSVSSPAEVKIVKRTESQPTSFAFDPSQLGGRHKRVGLALNKQTKRQKVDRKDGRIISSPTQPIPPKQDASRTSNESSPAGGVFSVGGDLDSPLMPRVSVESPSPRRRSPDSNVLTGENSFEHDTKPNRALHKGIDNCVDELVFDSELFPEGEGPDVETQEIQVAVQKLEISLKQKGKYLQTSDSIKLERQTRRVPVGRTSQEAQRSMMGKKIAGKQTLLSQFHFHT